jgi:hypothetical protein
MYIYLEISVFLNTVHITQWSVSSIIVTDI